MADLAERAEAGLYGPDEPAWAHRVERWLDDLRAAWSWARDAGELDLAVRLAAALTRYAYWRVHRDLLAWGSWVAATVPAHPRLAVAFAAGAAAAWVDGRLEEASELARRGVEAGGARRRRPRGPLEALGDVAMLTGDLAAALEAYRGSSPSPPRATWLRWPSPPPRTRPSRWPTPVTTGAPRGRRGGGGGGARLRQPDRHRHGPVRRGEAFADGRPGAGRGRPGRGDAAGRGRRQPVRGRRRPDGDGGPRGQARRTGGGAGPVPGGDRPLAGQPQPHPPGDHPRQPGRPAGADRRSSRGRPGRDPGGGPQNRSYGAEAARLATALTAVRRRLGETAFEAAWAAGVARTPEEAADDAMRLLDRLGARAGRRGRP